MPSLLDSRKTPLFKITSKFNKPKLLRYLKKVPRNQPKKLRFLLKLKLKKTKRNLKLNPTMKPMKMMLKTMKMTLRIMKMMNLIMMRTMMR